MEKSDIEILMEQRANLFEAIVNLDLDLLRLEDQISNLKSRKKHLIDDAVFKSQQVSKLLEERKEQ